MMSAAIIRKCRFERGHFVAEYVLTTVEDAGNCCSDRFRMRVILRDRRRERNHETTFTSGT